MPVRRKHMATRDALIRAYMAGAILALEPCSP